MTSARLLLAAGSVAAALVGVAPVLAQSGSTSTSPLQVGQKGVVVSVAQLQGKGSAIATVVAPADAARLTGTASGSPALAAQSRLTIVRVSDGATLFMGSLSTFRSLAVPPGTKLQLRVQKPAGFSRLRAGALLQWS